MFSFGDTFTFRGKQYIFLTVRGEILYAARILSEEESNKLTQAYDRIATQGGHRPERIEHPVYWFVALRSSDFEGRVAHLFKTQQEDDPYGQVPGPRLDLDDLREIQEHILKSGAPVARELREAMEQIDLSEDEE